MGRPRRNFKPDAVYLVRNFCLGYQARFLPEDTVNRIIRGLMAKHAQKFDIKIFAFVVMQSYFEILLSAPEQTLHQFMCHFQSDVAKAVNAHQGRHGVFFAGRYTAEPVMEDRLEDVLSTMIGLPCSEDLVAHPSEWPGVSSWQAHQTGEEIVGSWTDSADYWRLKRRHGENEYSDAQLRKMAATEYRIQLAKIPGWEEWSEEECAQKIDGFAQKHADIRAEAWAEHAGTKSGEKIQTPGVDAVMDCPNAYRTHTWHPVKRGQCWTWCEEVRAAFKVAQQKDEDRYTSAAIRRRRGISMAYFPAGMIPPGHLHCIGSQAAIDAGENPQEPRELEPVENSSPTVPQDAEVLERQSCSQEAMG